MERILSHNRADMAELRPLARLLPVLAAALLLTAAPTAPLPAPEAAGAESARGSRRSAPDLPIGAPAGPVASRELLAALDRAAGLERLAGLGIHVRDAATGGSVWGRRADDLFILASNTKIFSTAAALDGLGPGYLFTTRLDARGPVEDGALRGDLAVVGGGDPMVSWRLPEEDSYAVFRRWAAALRERGVDRVEGDVYLDHGFFDGPAIHPDWDPDKYLNWYQAPVEALTFDENTVRVRAVPAGRPGAPARVETDPDLPYFGLQGSVRTLPSWRGNLLRVHRSPGSDRLTVSGGVYLRARDLEKPIAIDDPVAYYGAALAAAFAEEGIELGGRTVAVPKRPGLVWDRVAVHHTSLLPVLEVTNHESQNLFAETLVKTLGAELCGAGSWDNGIRYVAELVERAGVEPESFRLYDGSGLSRSNRMAPSAVTRFLASMAFHPWADLYVESLPTGGEEGSSLEKRLREPPYPGRVHAKTGTLAGISTLSGYARGRSGRLYAFSVLAAGGAAGARRVQDAIARALVDHG